MPTTRTVSIRDFRDNLTTLLKEAQKKDIYFVIMRHGVPVATVSPMKKEQSLEALMEDVAIARDQAKRGDVYSTKEVRTLLGL